MGVSSTLHARPWGQLRADTAPIKVVEKKRPPSVGVTADPLFTLRLDVGGEDGDGADSPLTPHRAVQPH